LKVDFFRKYLLNFSQKFLNSPHGGGVVVVSGLIVGHAASVYVHWGNLRKSHERATKEPRKSHARATQEPRKSHAGATQEPRKSHATKHFSFI